MLRALMLRKKINDAKAALEALKANESDFESRALELQQRTDEAAQAIEEASTDEEKQVVEDTVTAIENDQAALDAEKAENDQKIGDLENEISEMEKELEEVEDQQRAKAPAKEPEKVITPDGEIKTERTTSKMFKTRALNKMTDIQRAEFVQREDVKKTLEGVRALISEKRTVTGSEVFIGVSIFELIRDNVIEYSKLYGRVKASFTKNNGRQPVEGTIPEAIWTEACAALNELDLSFDSVELDTYKVGGYFAICNARVEDSDIDLLDVFADALMQGIGYALDKAFVYGTGVKMPTGFVTGIADTASQLVTIPSNKTGKDLFKAIINAGGVADGKKSRGRITWIMNEKMYRTLKAEALEFNAAGALVSGIDGTMPVDGGDVVVLNFVPDNNIAFGYLDLYAALIKKEMTVSVSTECKFIEDQTVIKGLMRADGKSAVVKAFGAIGYGSAPTTEVDFPGVDPES
ncbi:MAG: phage major capsid protein [Clostridiales bacterium]|nr:phage major capsid protein [Clostridiales bacterium]